MFPSLQNKQGQSTAARSGRVMLSLPSSLPGRSDTPLPITALLPVSPDLSSAYHRRSAMEAVGLQVQGSSLFPRIPMTIPRVPDRFICPFHPLSTVAFPQGEEGRRVARPAAGFSPNRTLPAISSGILSRGCIIRFMLRSADLASTPGWVQPMSRFAVGRRG